jgi:hypothetical protein
MISVTHYIDVITGIEDQISTTLSVYPNPVNEAINIQSNLKE